MQQGNTGLKIRSKWALTTGGPRSAPLLPSSPLKWAAETPQLQDPSRAWTRAIRMSSDFRSHSWQSRKQKPTATQPVQPHSRDPAHSGWVQLSSCLSLGEPEKASLHHKQLGGVRKTGGAQLGMGCHEEKYCRKLPDVLVAFPLVLCSHSSARLRVAFLDISGLVHMLLS